MECKLDKNLLQDLLEGSIDPVEKIFIEEHLKVCRECRREYTELKLLFWDLNDKCNYNVELPVELDLIKDSILEKIEVKGLKNKTGMVIEQQKRTLQASGTFLEFVPGMNEGRKLMKEGFKAAPKVLGKASLGLIKGARTLLAK